MIHVYALMSAPTRMPELAGLEDARVEGREVERTTVALSRHAEAPACSDEGVLRHAHVVDELTRASASVLPARFGLAYADELALDTAVRDRADELHAALDAVRGCVEIGLRVLQPKRITEPAFAGGGDYLRARLREETESERLARGLHATLAPFARDTRRSRPSGEVLLSSAYLVPADSAERFRSEVRKLEEAYPQLDLVCTGPWPAYSFAPPAAPAGAGAAL